MIFHLHAHVNIYNIWPYRKPCITDKWDHRLQWNLQVVWRHEWPVHRCTGEGSSQPHPIRRREIHTQQRLRTHLPIQILRTVCLSQSMVRRALNYSKLFNKCKESKSTLFYHRTAFFCWLVANILFSMPVIIYAGYMMMVTAAFIFFSLASFSTIYNTAPCYFTIGADSFRANYSHSFWLALATGKCPQKENKLIQMISCQANKMLSDHVVF